MELLHNTTENRRYHSDATGLSGCRPLRRDLKIWRVLPRRRAKFVTVRRRNNAAPSCKARLAPHGRGPGLARCLPLGMVPMEGLRGATARRALRADGPAGGLKPGHGATGAPMTRFRARSLPAGRQTCVSLTAWDTNPVCVSGRGMRCAMTTRTAGTSIAEGRDASAWKGADGACR